MSKTKGFLLAVAAAAMAFTFSCGGHGIDELINGSGTAPTIIITSLPGGTVNTAYSQALAATGDTPITWSLESGELPTGLSLLGNGIISGTPATANTFSFIVKATNATGNDMKVLSITITAGSEPFPGSSSSVIPNPISSSSVGGGVDDFASKPWTYVANSMFGTARVYGVAFGNGVWVVVGSGRMAYSTDGRNWMAIPMGTGAGQSGISGSNGVNAVAFGNGRFIAVGANGSMTSSTDGRTWSAVASSGFDNNIHIIRIAFGGNRWVAGGNNARMATSTDGTNWTGVAASGFGTVDPVRAIGYGNNMWIAGNSRGRMATSTDGTSWTAIANTLTGFGTTVINKIAYGMNAAGNGMYVAVGDDGKIAWVEE